jgi:hypothetical protein
MRDLRASSSAVDAGSGLAAFVAMGAVATAGGLGAEAVVVDEVEVVVAACDMGSLFNFRGRRRWRFGPATAAASLEGGGTAAAFVAGFELISAFCFCFCSCSSKIPPADPARPIVCSETTAFRDRTGFGGDVVGFGPGD